MSRERKNPLEDGLGDFFKPKEVKRKPVSKKI